jgi:transcriptional regulator with XRE-family HTH domain
MPVKSDPTLGWPQKSLAVRLQQMVDQHQREMGARVARLRDQAGMTNESLARKSQLSVKTVSRFVNGKHEPREHTLKSLAKALGVTTEVIRGRPPSPFGLGAREDQLDGVAGEFGVRVDNVEAKLDEIVESLAEARAERGEQAEEIRALLRRQSKLLENIEKIVEGLGVPDDTSLQDHLVQELRDTLVRTAPPPES